MYCHEDMGFKMPLQSIFDFLMGPNIYVYWTPVVTDTCHRLGVYVVLKRELEMMGNSREKKKSCCRCLFF